MLEFGLGDRRYMDVRCFCCHVRTGTIILGMWHLMLEITALSIIAVMLRNPELFQERDLQVHQVPGGADIQSDRPLAMPSATKDIFGSESSSKLDFPQNQFFGTRNFVNHHNIVENLNVYVAGLFCSFGITLLMVIGVMKGKPSYLMPFFCLQLGDLCMSCLGYLFYIPDMHRIFVEDPNVPFHDELRRLALRLPSFPSVLGFWVFLCAMLIKIFFVSVVWSCYKHLTFRMVAARRTIHYIDTDNRMVSQSLLTDLPDYETAVKKYPTPPPSYDLATANAQPPPCAESQVSDSPVGQMVPSLTTQATTTPIPDSPKTTVTSGTTGTAH